MKRKNKKANILVENIIFIVLNVLFLTILVLFLFSKTGSAAVLEEKYAKQIALIIDSAKSGMIIHLDMEDAIENAGSPEDSAQDLSDLFVSLLDTEFSNG